MALIFLLDQLTATPLSRRRKPEAAVEQQKEAPVAAHRLAVAFVGGVVSVDVAVQVQVTSR